MATWGERIIEALGGMTRQEHEGAVRRAYEAGFDDGNDEPNSGTTASFGYRAAARKLRDFSKATPDQLQETAWALWQSSPIAKRIMTLKRDHIGGRNVTPVITGDDEAAELVDEFWQDNQLDKRVGEFILQLFLFGEQCYSVFVRQSDGRVRLGYVDPANISEVVCHPMNDLDFRAVVVGDAKMGRSKGKVYRVICLDEDVTDGERVTLARNPGRLVTADQATLEPWELAMLKEYGGRDMYDGSCILTRVNAMSNQSRGVSDLIQVADWIDQADETLFALGDREQYADYFSWDITLQNAGQDQIAKRQREIMANPPKKGSFNVHNDAETWELKYPELRQEGSIATYRAILGLILGGVGFPVHWFGYGDDANRATATVQSDPTLRSLEHDQSIVRDMLLFMVRFALDQAEIAGNLPANDEREVDIQMPELSDRDLARLIPLYGPYAIALMTAVEAGWMTQETAAKSWARLMAEIGIEIDPSTELEAVAADELAGEQQRNDQLAGRLGSIANEPDGRLTPADIPEDVVLNGSS